MRKLVIIGLICLCAVSLQNRDVFSKELVYNGARTDVLVAVVTKTSVKNTYMIIHDQSGTPISNATIELKVRNKYKLFGISDNQGSFGTYLFPDYLFSMRVSKVGYKSVEKEFIRTAKEEKDANNNDAFDKFYLDITLFPTTPVTPDIPVDPNTPVAPVIPDNPIHSVIPTCQDGYAKKSYEKDIFHNKKYLLESDLNTANSEEISEPVGTSSSAKQGLNNKRVQEYILENQGISINDRKIQIILVGLFITIVMIIKLWRKKNEDQ